MRDRVSGEISRGRTVKTCLSWAKKLAPVEPIVTGSFFEVGRLVVPDLDKRIGAVITSLGPAALTIGAT